MEGCLLLFASHGINGIEDNWSEVIKRLRECTVKLVTPDITKMLCFRQVITPDGTCEAPHGNLKGEKE